MSSTRSPRFSRCVSALCVLVLFAMPVVGTAQEAASSSTDDEVLSDLKLPKLRRKRTPRVVEEAAFKVVKGDGRMYFSLVSGEDVLLRSPGYATKRAIEDAMSDVVKHIKRVRDMPMRKLDTGEYYFVVVTARDDVLATSPLYSSMEEARTMRARLKRVLIKQDEEERAQN